MAFITDRCTGILRALIVALTIGFCSMIPIASQAAATESQTAPASGTCSGLPKLHSDPIFKDLKGVGLYVGVIGNKYERALKCHGKEGECATKAGVEPVNRQMDIQYYQEAYKNYPAPIRRDALIKAFSNRIREQLLPIVIPDENCHQPDVTVYEKLYPDVRDTVRQANRVTVFVKLHIIDKTDPAIAILSYTYYRPEDVQSKWELVWPFIDTVTAIPLNLPEDEIAAKSQNL